MELRSHIEQVEIGRQSISLTHVERALPDGQTQYLDVQLAPLLDNGGNCQGVGISFQDVTRYRQLRTDLEKSRQELETAYEELQSTNEELEPPTRNSSPRWRNWKRPTRNSSRPTRNWRP